MNWKDVGDFIGKHAPVLGGLLGGPGGAAIGTIVASTLGTEPTPEAVQRKITESPDMIFKLKELEAKDIQHLREVQYRTMNSQLKDVQHARESHKDHWMPWVLTVVLSMMVSGLTLGLMLYAIPESTKEVLFFIAGQIVNAFLTAVAYWLGTSRSSLEKTKHIGQVTKQ